ncbi:recombination mediator RecR [Granulibacter bethesdensis]|uniref:Recombination protein RecR n=2 Tax=Granulibacter bethesdensis TaxID=364410 RepID=RECR_GRABC|nr:recombination mediator RecR [Granulibacter bethesdensis]Q0BVJ5.1 RecName: Full=Recombination protein RecR [Granulibacter bethesdensis CGDNIH1]ABI61157.1 Recombination protein recR [Granulibacter bethesdensis CGDNIH1]AHJ62015.1 Recombination protein recR [Granulibacter bethesdensis]AHJ64634.1 Recombination protein recR [Granulibacter bethesdensis CGDNIH4]AHJ67256.1 Recombination protein recR [Granulibacter bethesdensis]APH50933.1 Recombination protein recR [Granulibacter bethesdensis]
MGGPELEQLIALLARLPGLGPRSARRAALRLLQQPETRLLPLAAAMQNAARAVKTCRVCGNLDSADPCSVCTDPSRENGLICVVESVGDLWAMDRAGIYRGLYHVLGGVLSALAGTGPDALNWPALMRRIESSRPSATPVTEVILALGATVDGATTAHWLAEQLRPMGVSVTRLAQGIPIGGALDVLDDGTLAAAMRARRSA